jgi:hypothetical protein
MAGLSIDVAIAQDQKPKPPLPPPVKKNTSSSFIDKVLKYLGISDMPGTLKGPGDEVVSGKIVITNLASLATRDVTSDGGYRSPIFTPGSDGILALHGHYLVRISAQSGEIKRLFPVANVTKLIGFKADDSENVLILQSGDASGRPIVGLLAVSTGKTTPLAYDPSWRVDLQMVENLQSWTRTYGDRQVYVSRQTKQALSGDVEWSDVFLKTDGQEPKDVSQCDGVDCGQPSLSADGRLLVFVKSASDVGGGN